MSAPVSAVSASASSPVGAGAVPIATTPRASNDAPSLLPDPSAASITSADPMAMLAFFESRDSTLSEQSGASRIQSFETARHDAFKQEQDAIQKAIDAAHHRSFWDDLGGIFGDVAKVAAVVASVAATVASFGAATPIAVLAISGAALSMASLADGEFHVLHALGVDDKTAGWIDLGMALGGAAASFGSTLVPGGPSASGQLLDLVARAGNGVQALGTIGGGVSTIGSTQSQAESDEAAADQVAAQARSGHLGRLIQTVLADVRTADEQSERAVQTISNITGIQNDTALAAAGAVRG